MNTHERVALAFVARHPEDAARLVERADPDDAAAFLASVPASTAADVYRALAPAAAASCSEQLNDETFANILEALPLDAAGAALRRVEAARHARVLALQSDERRNQLAVVLTYPENTAGALADPLVLTLPADITVAEAQRQLAGSHRRLFYYVYVVARDGTLVGALALPELMAARAQQKLASVMKRDVVCLDARANLATVVVHPAWRDFDALPVVDAARKLVGAIRHKTIRQLAREPARPMVETIVGLSELYWAGLSGILASLAAAQARAQEDENVT